MSKFTTTLTLRAWPPAAPKQYYTLLSDLVYESDLFGTITAPAGLGTDFASIPRAAYSLLDPEDPVICYPSVIHDYLYAFQGKTNGRIFTREEADSVLREAMLASGATSVQAAIVYRAVRLFGGSHWKS